MFLPGIPAVQPLTVQCPYITWNTNSLAPHQTYFTWNPNCPAPSLHIFTWNPNCPAPNLKGFLPEIPLVRPILSAVIVVQVTLAPGLFSTTVLLYILLP